MDVNHARTIPISNILNKLSITPEKINESKALYRSPLQHKAERSFWVYLNENRWHDFKLSKGGDTIDFASAYLEFSGEAHTIVDSIRWLSNLSDQTFSSEVIPSEAFVIVEEQRALSLKSIRPIQFKGLVKYLNDLRIPLLLAQDYLDEARVTNRDTGKTFYALAIRNENGGFELQTPFFKGCIKPRTITFIRGQKPQSQGIHVFKSALDFLSILAKVEQNKWEHDTILLNDLSCAQLAVPYIRNYTYRTMYTWMDNTLAGLNAARILTSGLQNEPDLTHVKMNKVFDGFDNVSTWHVHNQMSKL